MIAGLDPIPFQQAYEAAEAKGLDTSRGVPGPGDAATRRSSGPIADLRAHGGVLAAELAIAVRRDTNHAKRKTAHRD